MQDKQGRYTGCLLVLLLGVSFVVGGMMGGMLGSGLMYWALAPEPVAVAPTPTSTSTSTHTPVPTPTATPAPSATPTPTRVLKPTPSAEDVIERILPAVVTVVNVQTQYGYFGGPNDRRVVGSGVVVDERGYILTNAHVVAASETLKVILSSGRELPAALVVYEPSQDMAMLKVEADHLVAAPWGNSNRMRLGQPVIAIGSALGDFPNSVTMGVVSGLNRALAIDKTVLYGLIQTDAAINQGNSGGPLINLQGEVIGINTFIIREDHDQGVAQGIGFAIPASSAQELVSAWIAQDTGTLQASEGEGMGPVAPPLLPASQSGGQE